MWEGIGFEKSYFFFSLSFALLIQNLTSLSMYKNAYFLIMLDVYTSTSENVSLICTHAIPKFVPHVLSQ